MFSISFLRVPTESRDLLIGRIGEDERSRKGGYFVPLLIVVCELLDRGRGGRRRWKGRGDGEWEFVMFGNFLWEVWFVDRLSRKKEDRYGHIWSWWTWG